MPVIFYIPGGLRPLVDGQSRVELSLPGSGAVLDALHELWMNYPTLRDRIVNEQGEIREHVNVFVGNENIRHTGGLDTPIPPNAEINIVPAISGG